MPARRKPSSDSLLAGNKTAIGKRIGNAVSEQAAFEEIVGLIEQSRLQAIRAVNTTLIDLYWNVGEYISRKIDRKRRNSPRHYDFHLPHGWARKSVSFTQGRQLM